MGAHNRRHTHRNQDAAVVATSGHLDTDAEVKTSKFMVVLLAVTVWAGIVACQRQPQMEVPVPGIAFVSDRDGNNELYLLQADGTGLTRLTEDEALDGDPAWSADGRQLLFRSRRDGSSDIFLMDMRSGVLTNLARDPDTSLDDEFHPIWHPEAQQLALYTDRYAGASCSAHQLALLPLSGGTEHIQLLDLPPGNQISFAWSPDGTTLVFSARPCGQNTTNLYVWDRETGVTESLTDEALSPALYPSWSHAGGSIAFSSAADGDYDIYVLDVQHNQVTALTATPERDTQPSWSPDDSQIAFVSDRDGNLEVYIMASDGSNPRNLSQNPARDFLPNWSPVEPPAPIP